MDKLNRHIEDGQTPSMLLLVDDVVLDDETKDEMISKV